MLQFWLIYSEVKVIDPTKATTHVAPISSPQMRPQMRMEQATKDSLSSAPDGPGCLMSIWQSFLRFFEASFNLIKTIICCTCKSPFPDPFKQKVDHSAGERIYKEALALLESPSQLQTSSIRIGEELIAFTDQIIHTFEETLKIDPEATQFALITIQIDKLSLSTSLSSAEQQNLLSITASSLLTLLEGVSSKSPSYSFHVDYLRLSGNRIETHKKTCTYTFGESREHIYSTNALAFTRKGALEKFTGEYNRITQSTTAPEKLFDEDGKLLLMS